MALGHSPKIVTNGLVFAYDMGNSAKSWKGAPTTNLISNPRNLANNRTAPASCGSSFTDFATGGPTDGPFVRVTRVTASGIAADWPFEISYPSIAVGTTFKFSCYARSTNGTVSTIRFSNPDAEIVSFTLTPEWQRFSTTFTSGVQSGLQIMRINRSNSGDKTIGSIYDIADAQIEVSSVVTPFVNGTRSNTQAIVDLTGANTITANSLTYNTSGTFEFDGSTNFITVPDSNDLSFPSQVFAFDYWVYFNNTTSNNGIIGKGEGSWEYAIYANGTNGLRFVSWPVSGAGAVYTVLNTTFVAGKWYHHCWTADGTTIFLYVDGVLASTGTKGVTYSMGNGTSRVTIGAAGDAGGLRYLNGKLSNVKIYNRSLSASEVSQNFNALRGRYGI